MIDIGILAEITSKWDISGVWCLASIPSIIVVLMAYRTGFWGGSCSCLTLFVITVFATGDLGDAGSGSNFTPNSSYISNRSQTKIIERYKYSINDPDCIFSIRKGGTSTTTDDYAVFIPAEEMYVEDGWYKMKATGQRTTEDDFYLYDETIDPANVPTEIGGWGIPQWVYHPAAPTWIFGIGGLPALGVGIFIASKVL